MQKAQRWLTNARLLKYEVILLSQENLLLSTDRNLNLVEFLSGEKKEWDNIEHDYVEAIDLQSKVQEDLEENPLEGSINLFIDGSSVENGKRLNGYAVVNGYTTEALETGKLPSEWSVQTCEVFALLQALQILTNEVGHIYIDSKYAYGILHTFGKIWIEQGLISSKGKELKQVDFITAVLKEAEGPAKLSIIHVEAHKKGTSKLIVGNIMADKAPKEVALVVVAVLILFPALDFDRTPVFTNDEE